MGAVNITGYIKLHRSLADWEWWGDHNTTRLWMYLLISASFKDTRWRGNIIRAGQLITSYSSLAQKTGLSVQSVRTSLARLKSTGEIIIESTSQFTVATIANWGKYQADCEQVTSGTTSNQQAPNMQVTSDQQHRKNVEKVKNISTSQQPVGNCDDGKSFPPESKAYKAASYLDRMICERLQNKKPSDEKRLQSWAVHFDRLNRIDGQAWNDIGAVLQFSQEDRFWKSNILSGKKFRDKYFTLYAKMQSQEDPA